MKAHVVVSLLLSLGLLGCGLHRQRLPRDPLQAEARLAALIPNGTPLKDAIFTLHAQRLFYVFTIDPVTKVDLLLVGPSATPTLDRHGPEIRFEIRDGAVFNPRAAEIPKKLDPAPEPATPSGRGSS